VLEGWQICGAADGQDALATPADPLLLSVRSGARASMPGMMDTILNLGLNDEAVLGLARKAGNERFAWDSYRRFVQMYGDVVMGLKPVSKEDHDPFEVIIDMVKDKKGVKLDTELDADDLKELVAALQGADPRPHRPRLSHRPLGAALGRRGGGVRKLEQRPRLRLPRTQRHSAELGHGRQRAGHGVWQPGRQQRHRRGLLARCRHRRRPVQRRVPGQRAGRGRGGRHPHAAAGVAGGLAPLGRAGAGQRRRARREIPVAGRADARHLPAVLHAETTLENHFKDMQDLEFTIQEGKLWMLQTRNGKRTGAAMVRIAMEMLRRA
jgi:pyruvate,orthophosphate dikinase